MLAVVATAFDGGNKPTEKKMKVQEEQFKWIPASTTSYSGSDSARCNGEALQELNDCLVVESEGFKYACKPGDDSIYFVTCDEQCGNCSEDWIRSTEKAGICYSTGEEFYQYTCGEETKKQKSAIACADLDSAIWIPNKAMTNVCASSKVNDGECSGEVDFATAEAICAENGARLCTSEELEMDVAKGTGCKGDCGAVWTSDTCKQGDFVGHITTAGSRKCLHRYPPTCTQTSRPIAIARCCADGERDEDYPEGFHLAMAMDYDLSDGSCTSTPITEEYNCWVDPLTGRAQRFACKEGSSKIYSQYCGLDENCGRCRGEWKMNGEELDKCYKSDESLYMYTCTAP